MEVVMEGIPLIYKGRQISPENFRAFVYAADGTRRLVNSWADFEKHMQTGVWFASHENVPKKDAEVISIAKGASRKKRSK
jgi:hypothetical protein